MLPETIFGEILQELRDMNRRVTSIEDLLVKNEKNSHEAVEQMADYLKDHQQVTDFVVNDLTKKNEQIMRELQNHYIKLVAVLKPDLLGASRPNTKLISSENDPVYVTAKDFSVRMAEMSLIPTQPNNAAYYRVGFISDLGTTAYETIDERYPTFVNTAQNLRLVSTSANDTAAGTGVRTVMVGGLDASNNRYFELVNLAGTTPVTTTTQFTQLDIINSTVVGSGGAAAGTISVTNTAATINFGAVALGENAWRSGRVFTDQSAAGYIFGWTVGSYNAAVRANLMANHIAANTQATLVRCSAIVNNDTRTVTFPVPIKIPKNSLVTVKGIAKQEINEVTTAFQLYTRTE